MVGASVIMIGSASASRATTATQNVVVSEEPNPTILPLKSKKTSTDVHDGSVVSASVKPTASDTTSTASAVQSVSKTPSAPLPTTATTSTTAATETQSAPKQVLETSSNFTAVAAENNVNVSLIQHPSDTPQARRRQQEDIIVTVDRRFFTKIRTRATGVPKWLPKFLQPPELPPQEIPDGQLLLAGVVAGSTLEMARTSLLYPLATIKTRIQAEQGRRVSQRKRRKLKRRKYQHESQAVLSKQAAATMTMETETDASSTRVAEEKETQKEAQEKPRSLQVQNSTTTIGRSLSKTIQRRVQILVLTLIRQVRAGNLYAGINPTLAVTIPSTGVYFGVRDVTKRLLNKAVATPSPLDDIWIGLLGVVVADIVSLIVRTPAEVLSLRLQVGSGPSGSRGDGDDGDEDSESKEIDVGDWFQDSIERLPAVILTDLPYIGLRTAVNGFLVHGTESLGSYEVIVITTASLCALLTTPLDVARTRILIDSDDDPLNGLDGGSREGVLRTMKQVAEEEGGIRNLFRGWFERTAYLGLGRAWFDPISAIAYVAIRDSLLLKWFD